MARSPPRRRRWRLKASQKTTLVISLCSLIIIGAFLYLYYVDANPGVKLVIDWRFHVSIFDAQLGKNLTIPADIGVSGGVWMNHTLDGYGPPGYAPLSTRDTSGTIYVQSVAPRLFLLSEFFSIWGQAYNRNCVGYGSGTYCASSNSTLPVVSNGAREYCVAYSVPPIDNGKEWEIIINSRLPCQ